MVGSAVVQPGQVFPPIYLTVSPNGRLYVADEGNRRIQVFRLLPPLAPDTATPMAAI